MNWSVAYLPEAKKDLEKLDNSKRITVLKAIKKVSQNPLPMNMQGYGKPLGNQNRSSLAGLLKIKLKKDSLRIVYKLVKENEQMLIVVIGVREDSIVYDTADARIKKYNL